MSSHDGKWGREIKQQAEEQRREDDRTQRRLTAEEYLLHEAILAIFDDDNPDKPKFFFEGTQIPCANGSVEVVSVDTANAERLDFSHAVIDKWRQFKTGEAMPVARRAVTLQELANLCERHRGKLLPVPTTAQCDECLREQAEEIRC